MSANKFAAAAAAAVASGKVKEHDREGGGDFEETVAAAGLCVARLVSYIEVGTFPQKPFQGKAKPPAPECIVQFELLGKKHAREIEYTDDAGKQIKKTVYPIVTQRMTIKGGSRSGYTKLLEKLDYGRGTPMIAMLIGEAFKIAVVHKTVEKDGKSVTYANIKDANGEWLIYAPMNQKVDEETGEPIGDPYPIKAPEMTVEPRCLLWDAPDADQWMSLFIEGTRTVKGGEGKEDKEVSKNWIQNKVRSALNWEGSPVQALADELSGDLPSIPDDALDLDGVAGAVAKEQAAGEVLDDEPTADPVKSPDAQKPASQPLADAGDALDFLDEDDEDLPI